VKIADKILWCQDQKVSFVSHDHMTNLFSSWEHHIKRRASDIHVLPPMNGNVGHLAFNEAENYPRVPPQEKHGDVVTHYHHAPPQIRDRASALRSLCSCSEDSSSAFHDLNFYV
jgi:hypothetical protein